MGKIPVDLLERYVLRRTGVQDPSVLVGPGYGEDAAIVRVGDRFLAIHSDPITAAERGIGWLAINVASNDVAVRGARPRWASLVILLPERASEDLLDFITADIDRASKKLGIAVIGGHTEVVAGLARPVVIATVIGEIVRRPIATSSAREGDAVIMTKSAGLEGTAILAQDYRDILLKRGVEPSVLDRASRFIEMISVVREAITLAERDLATSMHDPTEGGVLGGAAEIAYASGKTIELWEESIPVAEETRIIASAIGIDPLKLISSGTLISTVPRDMAEEAVKTLRELGVEARIIGRVLDGGRGAYIVRKGGYREKIPRQVIDEIYRIPEILGKL
ncbi:MAG: AIR synthase family protein [Sulfolobales archaeon]